MAEVYRTVMKKKGSFKYMGGWMGVMKVLESSLACKRQVKTYGNGGAIGIEIGQIKKDAQMKRE